MDKEKKFNIIAATVACFAISAIWLVPIIFSLLTSLKSESEILTSGYSFFPKQITFFNYQDVLINNVATTPILKWFKNSLFVSVIHTILVLIVSSTSAFAYSRLEFKGKNTLFWTLMGTMMFPNIISLIPLYKVCSVLNIINTHWALILPGVSSVFNIFLIRQFMLAIPKDLDEAARIDGANTFQLFYKIILPLCLPVLTVIGMFSFTGVWNDFLWSSLAINNVEKMTITPGLQLLKGTYDSYPAHSMAGAIVSIIPTFVLFLFTQKYFLKGMNLSSGVKG